MMFESASVNPATTLNSMCTFQACTADSVSTADRCTLSSRYHANRISTFTPATATLGSQVSRATCASIPAMANCKYGKAKAHLTPILGMATFACTAYFPRWTYILATATSMPTPKPDQNCLPDESRAPDMEMTCRRF